MTTEGRTGQSKPRVAVLFGGRSSEHAVSCVTAAGVMGAIDKDKYDVIPIGIAKTGQWVLASGETNEWSLSASSLPEVAPSAQTVALAEIGGEHQLIVASPNTVPEELGAVDVVFPLLHGPFGEDGTIQGLLELSDTRYVGAGVLASAVGMDKHFMKVVFESAGLHVGPYIAVTDRQWRNDPETVRKRVDQLGFPVFVKPARAGSSMGISKVDSIEGLDAAIETAREHDPKLVIEAGITGREIECAVLEGRGTDAPRTSMPGEISVAGGGHEFYDFNAKYVDDAAALSCPADLPEEAITRVRELAAVAFDAVGGEGLSRVDFFYTPDGELIINEINTMPGFTPKSMYPQMWKASGLGYAELIDELIHLALHRKTGLRYAATRRYLLVGRFCRSSWPTQFRVAGIFTAAEERSASTVAELILSGSIRISVAGSRPNVVSVHTGLPSLMTQSTPLTLTQRSVVGPGTLTPQRRITADGSPQAAVAWALVLRSLASPIASGRASIIGAQAAFAASLAGVTSTTGEHDVKDKPVAAAAATRAMRAEIRRLNWSIHPA